jgi:hypothetical protein
LEHRRAVILPASDGPEQAAATARATISCAVCRRDSAEPAAQRRALVTDMIGLYAAVATKKRTARAFSSVPRTSIFMARNV